MARQRSGSSSARNPRGPGGTRPASTRSTGKPAAKPAVEEPVSEESASDEPVVEESTAESVPDEIDIDPVETAADKSEVDDVDDVDESDEDESDVDESDEDDEDDATDTVERSAATAEFWASVRVVPVEIALPRGTGYTLRAYRMSNEIAAVEVDEREDEFAGYLGEPEAEEIDPELLELLAQEPPATIDNRKVNGRKLETRKIDDEDDLDDDDDLDIDDEFDEDDDLDADDDDDDLDVADDDVDAEADDDDEDDNEKDDDDVADNELSDADDEDDEDEDEDDDVAVEPAAEEVPVFLGRRGKIYLFESAESLVDFVHASEEHDLAQLDTWSELRERLTADDVVPDTADRYELDLVVENLRGGADALDYSLLIQAGEVARDIAFATRLEAVIAALAPGSRLDDLDEAVRTADGGGLRGFLARRKLRRIVTQQTALGWRTIIGKISAVVDWRN